jgi:hypothetical protein
MAFNLLSGKIEKGDWTCGAADDVQAMSSTPTTRARPDGMKNIVLGFAAGVLAGCSYLYWEDLRRDIRRMKLPENA